MQRPTPPHPALERLRRPLRIALVSNFFYPRLGGVEMHIYCLAQCLVRRGHKVVIVTHACAGRDDASKVDGDDGNDDDGRRGPRPTRRTSVRYLPGPVKVYHCPILPMVDGASFPTFIATYPLLRQIFLREQIDLVHSHQATSTLGHEAIVYANQLGLGAVYTDHSLFGFNDVASVVLNKVLRVVLSCADASIAVSHTCRDNLILRAALDPSSVVAIPNAVDATKFRPDPSRRPKSQEDGGDVINIVVLSRLVYRKGVDLMVGLIPRVCALLPNVKFIVGGDGNKRLDLEETVERHRLQDRVEFLGAVPHADVRGVLVRGHLFLNCSLTESFCIAILEAACCGLYVVSTDVGGVPEVLPCPEVMSLAEPTVEALVGAVVDAVEGRRVHETVDPHELHRRVQGMYSWDAVAGRTEAVYDEVLARPRIGLRERLERYLTAGVLSGGFACVVILALHFWSTLVVERWQPRCDVDVVPDLMMRTAKRGGGEGSRDDDGREVSS